MRGIGISVRLWRGKNGVLGYSADSGICYTSAGAAGDVRCWHINSRFMVEVDNVLVDIITVTITSLAISALVVKGIDSKR